MKKIFWFCVLDIVLDTVLDIVLDIVRYCLDIVLIKLYNFNTHEVEEVYNTILGNL